MDCSDFEHAIFRATDHLDRNVATRVRDLTACRQPRAQRPLHSIVPRAAKRHVRVPAHLDEWDSAGELAHYVAMEEKLDACAHLRSVRLAYRSASVATASSASPTIFSANSTNLVPANPPPSITAIAARPISAISTHARAHARP